MAFLELQHVSKSFVSSGMARAVLDDVSLSVADGEFVAIVGFSGSGKTTLLNLVAGLLRPDLGRIALAGAEIVGPGPDRGVVFQNYALLPWLTVEGNLRLAIDALFADWPAERRQRHLEHHLELVNLSAARDKFPRQLSGGMRQRVSVARALAMDPRILLLDEPLSALDALTRATLQTEIERIWRANRKTVLMITNDVDEALLLADRIVPLTPGPGATLGPSIAVTLPRPRDRQALNHDPEFKRLRASVTTWLLDSATAWTRSTTFERRTPRLLAASRAA